MISKLPAVFTLIHLMMVEILQINNLNSVSNCNYEDTSTRPNQMWWRPHISCVVGQNMRWHVRSCLETTKPQQADTMVDHKQGFVPLSRVLVQIKYFDRAPPRPRPPHPTQTFSTALFSYLLSKILLLVQIASLIPTLCDTLNSE